MACGMRSDVMSSQRRLAGRWADYPAAAKASQAAGRRHSAGGSGTQENTTTEAIGRCFLIAHGESVLSSSVVQYRNPRIPGQLAWASSTSASRLAVGTSAWSVIPGSNMYPPPLPISSFSRRTSSRISCGVPCGRRSCVRTPPQNVSREPNSRFSSTMSHRLGLDGVQYVQPQIDQVANHRNDVPATVVEDRSIVFLCQAVDFGQPRLDELVPVRGRHQQAPLRAVVVAERHAIELKPREQYLHCPQDMVGQSAKQFLDKTGIEGQIKQYCLHSPHERGPLPQVADPQYGVVAGVGDCPLPAKCANRYAAVGSGNR